MLELVRWLQNAINHVIRPTPNESPAEPLFHVPPLRERLTAQDASRPRLTPKWPLPESRLIRTLTEHTGRVEAIAIAPDGTWLATASSDTTVRLWRADGRPMSLLEGHTARVNALAIAPDGTWLATASNDRTLRIWRVGEQPACAAVARLDTALYDVAVTASGLVFACGYNDLYAFELSGWTA